jgi:hypothetical protein
MLNEELPVRPTRDWPCLGFHGLTPASKEQSSHCRSVVSGDLEYALASWIDFGAKPVPVDHRLQPIADHLQRLFPRAALGPGFEQRYFSNPESTVASHFAFESHLDDRTPIGVRAFRSDQCAAPSN